MQDGTNVYLNYEREVKEVRYIFNVVCGGETVNFIDLWLPEGTVFETEEQLREAVVVQDPVYHNGTAFHFTGFEQSGTTVNLYYE